MPSGLPGPPGGWAAKADPRLSASDAAATARKRDVLLDITVLLDRLADDAAVTTLGRCAFGKAQRRGIALPSCYALSCGNYATLRAPFAVTPRNPFGGQLSRKRSGLRVKL